MAQIFSPAQIAGIQQALQDAEKGKQICVKGAACGFDTQAAHATLQAAQDRLSRVLSEFVQQGTSQS